jgi:ribosomal protein S11
MQTPTPVLLAMIIIGLPTIMIMLVANRFFKFREKKLEAEAMNAAEKAAQYVARSSELEERVRVLEQIVTDSGAQTAAQIEALRASPLKAASRKRTSIASEGTKE